MMRLLLALICGLALAPAFVADAAAQAVMTSDIAIDKADTVWLLVSTALVMIMAPGLAFFYSGMVHSTNVVATLMHSYMKLCVIMTVWVLWGYSLVFGDSINGFIGGLSMLGLDGVDGSAISEDLPIPHYIFVLFQGMFAVITAAIITGAFAERVRLGPILVFSTLWITLVYAPVAHWIWGGGWVSQHFEALDFAGGAVVHINSGVAGLIAALILGKRVRSAEQARPHNLPLTVIGASLLWFGWFGFNGGSALAADGIAALAVTNTCIAAGTAAVGWFIVESIHRNAQVTALGIISGSIAGLVAITPAAGFVTPMASIIIGLIAGVVCYYAIALIKPKFGYDDSLDAFGIHGVGGLWGAIATGLFATTTVNTAGADGLFYGNPALLWSELIASGIVIAYSAAATFVILQVVRKFVRVRVTEAEEVEGLDRTQHGESGYTLS